MMMDNNPSSVPPVMTISRPGQFPTADTGRQSGPSDEDQTGGPLHSNTGQGGEEGEVTTGRTLHMEDV